ncbi:S8 family serine peptidase [Amphiplicatus metriothermophilus]|uniref:Subtilase family protein n=1 Tax=Amphiplicatus metriothermophilus TaxID=1519374 RepID=A0A239PWR8_9PROT|nr:S8 family serine peptidase [Amphiplicatus metriothermophilus]MBB5519573.1 subtilisin family serine protease [Amphiplicatus metriothermophilus]SNT74137.1 Subtilase family protein [Amphiplicatus metriothermophilus]
MRRGGRGARQGRLQAVAGALILAAAFAVSARAQPPGGLPDLDDMIDAAIEDRVEEAVAESIEAQVEETVVNSVERNVARNVEQAVERSVAAGVEQTVEQAVEAAVEGDVAGMIETAVESRVVDRLELDAARAVETGLAVAAENASIPREIAEEATAPSRALLGGEEAEGRRREPIIEIVDGWPAIRHEWVAVVAEADAQAIEALGVEILAREPLAASGEVMFVLRVSDADSKAGAIETALARLGRGRLDRNHIYDPAFAPRPGIVRGMETPAEEARADAAGAGRAVRIGLIDTAIDETHPALAGSEIVARDFVALGSVRPRAHGTAVASLMAGAIGHYTEPSARLEISAASVFFETREGRRGATTAALVRAVDWLRGRNVKVANVSLAGPPNRALEAAIASAREAGMVFVAAVGNEGPAARPLYPAAYEGVVGVTAVDGEGALFRWALRGPQVDIAALGVDVAVAAPGGGMRRDSGTSFAAPLVSVFLADRLEPAASPNAARAALRAAAVSPPACPAGCKDLYGLGLLLPLKAARQATKS